MTRSGGLRRNPSLLIEAVALAIWVEFLLRFRPIEQALGTKLPRSLSTRTHDDLSDTFLRAMEYAYRILPFDATCLKQALVFCLYRRRRGLAAELRIGVQKAGQAFAAHAWVEDEHGTPLTDPQEGFSPLHLRAR